MKKSNKKTKSAFTLVELLAVIVILAIILIIAIPQIMSTIKTSRLSAIKDSALLLATNAEKDYITQLTLDQYYNASSIECSEVVKLSDDYDIDNCSVTYNEGVATVTLKGKDGGKFSGITCTGTKDNMCCSIEGETGECSSSGGSGSGGETITTQPQVPVTETIYWALQDNDSDDTNETLVISDSEVTGNYQGSFAGNTGFATYSMVPWIAGTYNTTDNLSYNVTNVRIESIVAPKNTSNWFYGVGYNASSFTADLSNLNVSNVMNMISMFEATGSNATTWSIGDLSNWNTSKVKYMNWMFAMAGRTNATTFDVGDLSNWNTSSVTNMSYMFIQAGSNATTWSIGDLNNWNTSSVTNMSDMFADAGMYTTTFSLNLSNWDTSNVTNMSRMFQSTGKNATTFSLNLSDWNVSNVTDMSNMFINAGMYTTTFSLNLSNWNTSNVTNMSGMITYAGNASTTWSITIPNTNGNGINNTINKMYGKTTSNCVYASSSKNGRTFTLAS